MRKYLKSINMFERIPSSKEALTWVQKLLNPVTLVPNKLVQTLVGVIFTITLGEVCLYKMIHQDIRAGEMPSHLADTLIIGHGIVELGLAPLVSWWGYRWRRRMLITWVAVITACLASWFLLPTANHRQESVLCNDDNKSNELTFTGVTWISGVRLTIFLITGVLFIMARVGVWSHGLAYLEEYAPERIPLHYSVLVIGRVVPMLIEGTIVTMIERNISIQATFLLIGIIINLLQLYVIIPNQNPEVKGVLKTPPPMNDRCFSKSIGRVMNNPLVVSQLLAMGLLAASLWGYSYSKFDIVKVKFNIDPKKDYSSDIAEYIQYIFLIIFVVFAGTRLSTPILPKFSKLVGIKKALTMSALVLILYVLLAVLPTCDKGKIAGVDGTAYDTPECSSQCGCQPGLQEFSPVCMLDDMTTYWSACEAGCSSRGYINGVSVFTNCTCGVVASVGACSERRCSSAYQQHQTLFLLLVAVTIVGLSAQGVVLLKAVDPRDRSVVLGVGGATVALVVNICTHTYFSFIKAGSCSWVQSERCQVPTTTMPTIVTASSLTLAATSFIITLITWIQLRRSHKKRIATSIS